MAITISLTSGGGYFGSVLTHDSPNAGNWYADNVLLVGQTATTYTITKLTEGQSFSWRDTVSGERSNSLHYLVPSDIPNLVGWWDASRDDLMTLVGSNISAIASKKSGGSEWAQATDSIRPAYNAAGRNGKPAIMVDLGDYMTANNANSFPAGANAGHVFCTAYYSPAAITGEWATIVQWGTANSGSRSVVLRNSTSIPGNSLGSAGTDNFLASPAWLNDDHLVAALTNGTGLDFWLDGQYSISRSATINSLPATATRLFGHMYATGRWVGSMQDLFIFQASLNTADRQKMEGYMAHKWGLTSKLAVSHPYKTAAPIVADIEVNTALGSIVSLSTLVQDVNVAVEATLGSVVGAIPITALKAFAGSAVLGNLSVEADLESIEQLAGPIILGGITGSGALTSSQPVQVNATLGAVTAVGVLQPEESLSVLATLGQLIGSAVLETSEPSVFIGEAILGALAVEGEIIVPEFFAVEVLGTLGELIGTSILIEDTPGYLIVEDGTIVPDANSYVERDWVDTYLDAQGYSDWLAATGDARDGAIVRATTGIDAIYGSRYPGEPTAGRQQSLLWPRTDAEDVDCEEIGENEIPLEIQKAVAEAAYLEWLTPGYLTPNWTPDQLVTKETLGPLSVSYSDPSQFGRGGNLPTLSKIDSILAPLIGSGTVSLFGKTVRK